MATKNSTYRMGSRFLGLIVLALFLMSCSFQPKTNLNQQVELSDKSVIILLNGIRSDNYGVKMSSIYLAGKYNIVDVSQDLVEVMKNSNDDELCKMLVWSLYEIGNDSCCSELLAIVKNHPSEKIRDFCANLHKIKEYETAVANN